MFIPLYGVLSFLVRTRYSDWCQFIFIKSHRSVDQPSTTQFQSAMVGIVYFVHAPPSIKATFCVILLSLVKLWSHLAGGKNILYLSLSPPDDQYSSSFRLDIRTWVNTRQHAASFSPTTLRLLRQLDEVVVVYRECGKPVTSAAMAATSLATSRGAWLVSGSDNRKLCPHLMRQK